MGGAPERARSAPSPGKGPVPPSSQAARFSAPWASLSCALASCPGNGVAGFVDRSERDRDDRPAVLDHVRKALADKSALGRREILNRPAMREPARALEA